MLSDLNGGCSTRPFVSHLHFQKLSLPHQARLLILVYAREEVHPDELWQSKSDFPINIPLQLFMSVTPYVIDSNVMILRLFEISATLVSDYVFVHAIPFPPFVSLSCIIYD